MPIASALPPSRALARALALSLAAALSPAAALAADPAPRAGADLSVEASRPAPNDLLRAQAYFEADGANPAELAKKVNAAIEQALRTARAQPAVAVKSGGTNTWPVYGKSGRTIEGWRMRSTLLLESGNAPALSELLGRLQQQLAIGELSASPSPQTWKRIEDETIVDAIHAFGERARLVGDTLKRPWRIQQLSVQTSGGRPPVMPYLRAAKMQAAAEAMSAPPIEGGDSPVSVTVSGRIEFLD